MESLKLCIFSDIHYTNEEVNWKVKRKLVEYADSLTDKMIYEINNKINPDIVVHLGDMIQASKDIEINKNNIVHILNKFKNIKVPYYTLIGNHELKSVDSNKEIINLIGYENATFFKDVGEYHLVFLGTDINEEDEKYRTQYISLKDMELLEKDLEKNKNKKTIIFSHFGIAEDTNIKDNYWAYSEGGENLMLRNREKSKEIVKKANVIAVFCGHQHWTKTIIEDGIPYYMIGSLTENINDDGVPDGIYVIVEINGENITVQEKHLKI